MWRNELVHDIGRLFQQEGNLDDSPLLFRDGRIEGRFGDLRLSSIYRGIHSTTHPDVVEGLQACLRVYADSESPVAALDVFAAAQDSVAVINLDRLCRTLHLLNYLPLTRSASRLFLHVNPYHVLGVKKNHGAYFENILGRCGLVPEQVVLCVALRLSVGRKSPALLQGLANYRERGYRLALQTTTKPGLETLDMDFIRQVRPHYLLVPHGFTSAANWVEQQAQVARLRTVVTDTHAANIKVVVDGIETQAQAELSSLAGADFVAGHQFEVSRYSPPPAPRQEDLFRNFEINRAPDRPWQRSETSTLSLLGRQWQP